MSSIGSCAGSLNWMSYAISIAPSLFRRRINRPWIRRRSGFVSYLSKVSASIATTAKPVGSVLPSIEKRQSTVPRSSSPEDVRRVGHEPRPHDAEPHGDEER
jgi:hypothetical protein